MFAIGIIRIGKWGDPHFRTTPHRDPPTVVPVGRPSAAARAVTLAVCTHMRSSAVRSVFRRPLFLLLRVRRLERCELGGGSGGCRLGLCAAILKLVRSHRLLRRLHLGTHVAGSTRSIVRVTTQLVRHTLRQRPALKLGVAVFTLPLRQRLLHQLAIDPHTQ